MKPQVVGYRRPNGTVGIRNHIAILSAMDNTNPTANRIERLVSGTIALTTPFGRSQIGHDFEMTLKTLSGIGNHPNIAAVLVLSISLESAKQFADRIRPTGKPVEVQGLQESGGTVDLTAKGVKIATQMVIDASAHNRQVCDFTDFTIGVECGGSDTTSGIASNPVIGIFADRFIDAGGTIILSEPAEFMGAEHILARRCKSEEDKLRIIEIVKWYEDEAKRAGLDMRGTNPTPDNIEGGLTTLEEKSLGAIAKGGSKPIEEVIDYAQMPSKRGLVIMNTPSAACESMTGLVAGGAHIIIFSTGRGNVIGAPIAPTVKVCGNPYTVKNMSENIDLDVSEIITDGKSQKIGADKLWDLIIEIAGGKLARCEVLQENQLSVSRFGPSV